MNAKRVIVTRSVDQAGELAGLLVEFGFDPVLVPSVSVVPVDFELPDHADWFVFTSVNGARSVPCVPIGSRVAVVGPATAAAVLRDVDLVAPAATSASLASAFPTGSGTVVVVRGELADRTLPQALRERGWNVVEVVAYRTLVGATGPAPTADVITFASPSAVRGFVSGCGRAAVPSVVVTIGPTTTAECERLDIPVTIEADPHTVMGLVDSVRKAML